MKQTTAEPKNEIIIYQPNETLRLEVRVEQDQVWLNRQQMAKLFGRDVKTIGKHIANALNEELAPVAANYAMAERSAAVVANFATTALDGKTYQVEHYGLDVVTSVGYRVKSREGVVFRRWANEVLRRFLLNGVVTGRRYDSLALEMDRRFADHDRQLIDLRQDVDYFIRSSLPRPLPRR